MTATKRIVSIPETVGEFIKLLQEYPADYSLDLFTTTYNDFGSEEEAVYTLKIQPFENSKSLEITCN